MSKYRILCIELGEYLSCDRSKTILFSSLESSKLSHRNIFEVSNKAEAMSHFNSMDSNNAIKINKQHFVYLCANPEMFEIVEFPDE